VPRKQNVQHKAVFVDRSPQPVSNAIHTGTDLVKKPAGTLLGFPLTQAMYEERAELSAPFAQRFVAHLDTSLVEQFLNVPVTQKKAVIQPNSVLDDHHGETVVVGLGIGHDGSAYPDPVKATQPDSQLGPDKYLTDFGGSRQRQSAYFGIKQLRLRKVQQQHPDDRPFPEQLQAGDRLKPVGFDERPHHRVGDGLLFD